jgi:hypothetical protein
MASYYQKILKEIAPKLNPAGVEASMRLQYGTLSHLPNSIFKSEARLAAACEREEPGFLRKAAISMGFADDYAEWENGAV